MPDPDSFVARLRRRLFVGEFLRGAAGWIAGFLVAFGTAVLAVKLFAPRYVPEVYWAGLVVLPVLGVVAWRASKRVPPDREAVALLDSRLEAGGLLMTLAERPDLRWRERLPAAEKWTAALPKVRPVRFAKAVAVPALFAAGAGFVPVREEPPPAPHATAGGDAAAELASTFELLERADALDEKTRATIKQELGQLAEEAADKPLTHEKWETVDALMERMKSGFEATAMSVLKGRAAAAALSATAGGEPLTAERAEQLSEELVEALETLRKNGAFDQAAGGEAPALPPELQQLLKAGEFKLPGDAETRAATLEQLRRLLETEQGRLAEARGLLPSGFDAADLAGDLFGHVGDLFGVAGELAGSPTPGQGAGRGGEGAELTFGLESDEQAAKFKEAVLPPGFLDGPSGETVGVTGAAPEVAPTPAGPRNAPRAGGSATGNATWDPPLRPRHRDVVRGYFGDG